MLVWRGITLYLTEIWVTNFELFRMYGRYSTVVEVFHIFLLKLFVTGSLVTYTSKLVLRFRKNGGLATGNFHNDPAQLIMDIYS